MRQFQQEDQIGPDQDPNYKRLSVQATTSSQSAAFKQSGGRTGRNGNAGPRFKDDDEDDVDSDSEHQKEDEQHAKAESDSGKPPESCHKHPVDPPDGPDKCKKEPKPSDCPQSDE